MSEETPLFGTVTNRFLTDKQIDELTDPRVLAERIPGLAAKYDAVKEVRGAYTSEMTKYTHKSHDGWSHVGSIPTEVATVLYTLYTPEELAADGGKIIKEWISRHSEVRVSNENL